MPTYRVEALEKFIVRTTHRVTANTPAQAEQLCREGRVSYDEKTIEEGDEEWLETVSIESLDSSAGRNAALSPTLRMTLLSITNEQAHVLMYALLHYRDAVAKAKTRDREGRNPSTYYIETMELCSQLIEKVHTADYTEEDDTA
jgi:hypothetical protein